MFDILDENIGETMKTGSQLVGKGLKSVRDILSDGFKQGHFFLNALGNATDVKLKNDKARILKRAVLTKDYYKIRVILHSVSWDFNRK